MTETTALPSPATSRADNHARSLDAALALLLGVAALVLYVGTLAPTVLWGDDAYFQRTAFTGELPPDGGGHWLWLQAAQFMVHLPWGDGATGDGAIGDIAIGDIAYRTNLLSAIAAAGTVLAPANGLTDESFYVIGGLTRQIGRNANLATNVYVNWFDGDGGNNDATAAGVSASYNHPIPGRLVARAAVAVDYLDSESTVQDFAFATALAGLRYDF